MEFEKIWICKYCGKEFTEDDLIDMGVMDIPQSSMDFVCNECVEKQIEALREINI